jgi:hypothetical protein
MGGSQKSSGLSRIVRGVEGQAIVIKYFFFLHLLQPTLAPRIIRTSMTANNILFLN